jgi:hypothetical protein
VHLLGILPEPIESGLSIPSYRSRAKTMGPLCPADRPTPAWRYWEPPSAGSGRGPLSLAPFPCADRRLWSWSRCHRRSGSYDPVWRRKTRRCRVVRRHPRPELEQLAPARIPSLSGRALPPAARI